MFKRFKLENKVQFVLCNECFNVLNRNKTTDSNENII